MMPDGSWIKIEHNSLAKILENFRPVIYHPQDPRYRHFWQQLRKKCIEGIWVEQFGKWRYVPGRLGFFGIFPRFIKWNEEEGTREIHTPSVRDLEWHRAYYRAEMDGFSGWSDDDKYTSDLAVFEIDKYSDYNINDKRYLSLFTNKGNYKEFVPPRENLFMLHDNPRGKPLYWNEAQNHIEFGTRGGGKSYWDGLGEIFPDLCFSGKKYYEPGEDTTAVAHIEVTSGGGGKATELLEKVEFAMTCLGDPEYPELGVWGKSEEDEDYEPCPFYKRMTGDIKANNRENPWKNKFLVQIGKKWVPRGNGDSVTNTAYAVQQKTGAQKSAGGRKTKVTHEEFGENLRGLEAWGSNEGLLSEAGYKYAGQKAIGTSGNIISVKSAKAIMTNPRHYKCLVFKYLEESKESGSFIPAYMSDQRFKDKDGNTNVEVARQYHEDELNKLIEEGAPQDVILSRKMNYPLKIDHMWITGKGTILPVKEAEARESELLKGNLYDELATYISLHLDSKTDTGVGYDVLFKSDVVPFTDWPLEEERRSRDIVFTMYIHPDKLKVNGILPPDVTFALHDPYISEEDGESLGVTYWIVNPKYLGHGLPGNCIAASLIGRAKGGTKAYNNALELGMQFYGNSLQSLCYEGNKGDKVRSHFVLKKKISLLFPRPQYQQGQWIFQRRTTQTGYIVSPRIVKVSLIDGISDWLKEETEINGETLLNIERIPCLFLLRQIKQFNFDDNFDAVDAMQGISLVIGEQEHKISRKVRGDNPLKVFTEHFRKMSKAYDA